MKTSAAPGPKRDRRHPTSVAVLTALLIGTVLAGCQKPSHPPLARAPGNHYPMGWNNRIAITNDATGSLTLVDAGIYAEGPAPAG